MTEFRQDAIVGRWVLVRVSDIWPPDRYHAGQAPRGAAISPFIYGREDMTPPEVDAIRPKDTRPDTPGWTVRTVPNKFPALRIEGGLDPRGVGIYDMYNGVGAHEVVIETPDPRKQMADFSVAEVADVIKMYQNRYSSLAKDRRFRYIAIFKNYGESAGASLEHAHSQIIALPILPKYFEEKLQGADRYFSFRGRSIYADILRKEYTDRERIVTENEDFVAFCPYTPRYAFEVSIFPKDTSSNFGGLSDKQRLSLGEILKEVLVRLKQCLNDPSLNYYFNINPVNSEPQENFLWHIDIIPQLFRSAEMEWGTELYVVNTPPDAAARFLREISYTAQV